MNRWVLTILLLLPATAAARSERQGHIPNGSVFSCDSCHGRASLQVKDLTPFGVDVNRNMVGGVVQWQNIWNLDSDGDGFTNGLELNDPNGTWRRGQPNPGGPVANPGIANRGICGNNVIEPDEDCESLGDMTCRDLGLGNGSLECRNCRWYTFFCGVCGDGVLNPLKEDCDLDQFGDNTCASFGFRAGELACGTDCKIDSSDCNDEPPAVCGDALLSRGEQCDGDLFGTVDCARLNYAGGVLRCTAGVNGTPHNASPKSTPPSNALTKTRASTLNRMPARTGAARAATTSTTATGW
ncbi:MAG: hypothetical protein R3E66_17045 [bacterium]